MNLNQLQYGPGLLALLILFIIIVLLMEKRFFSFVQKYWFYKRSFLSYCSTLFYLLGFGGLLISLLDIRGPEEKIKMEVPADRTIILIDTSASMLAEDVKPSRLKKAAFFAKHFVKNAAGHQISIIAFAEVHKKIVPFTNDTDLINSRLDSIEHLRNHYGSSAVTLAIQESVQYFREAGGEARGNILVITDGEETTEGLNLNIPKGIHVALVGVGTERGGRIPLDDGRGFRFGYKKEGSRDVITKLDEKFFKVLASEIPSAKYWLVNSYSLPSEEILTFFQGEKEKTNSQQDMVIKPVLMEWIVVPSLALLVLAYLFKSIRVFTLGVFLILGPLQGYSQDKKEPELSAETISKLDALQRGELNQLQKLKLADDLQNAGADDEAIALFEENLPAKPDSTIPPEAYLNYGTTLLKKGELEKGLSIYQKLSDHLGNDDKAAKLRETMDRNVVSSFRKQEEKKQQEKQNKNKQENKDNQDNQDNQNSNQQNKDQSKGNNQNQKDPKDGDQQDKDKDQGKDQDKKDKDKDSDKDQDKDKKEPDQSKEDKQKKMPPQKIPAKLKQLMSDDRQLQMKMIENGTRDLNRRKSRKSKDW